EDARRKRRDSGPRESRGLSPASQSRRERTTMTTKRILVPLDGDERSEAIVPLVAAVARDGGATVRLLRVYPVPERREGTHGRTVEYVDQAMSRLTADGAGGLLDQMQVLHEEIELHLRREVALDDERPAHLQHA